MKTTEMRVVAVGMDELSGAPVVVLKDLGNKWSLPIWIGLAEARAITFAANKIESPRPLTHPLLHSTIDSVGYKLKEVLINSIEGSTFIASLLLSPKVDESGLEPISVDARPSDAIAVALLADAPLLVADEVIEQAAFSMDQMPSGSGDEESKFKDFLSGLKASDFKFDGPIELPPE